ncbi:hypothetical protein [Synechococcus sp. PCC 7335]|uniref:hypothetical protein n=1 Tax=Synechococcus sp. (strain ATCC 29403 / PCC 7335) TaxID=91464 RepID=UPI0002FD27F3|nr:hypothetical protein [Synechococcus sp. PCC 7335]
MPQHNSIEIRLKGDGMMPGLVRSRDLAQLIEAVEDMIAAEVVASNSDIKKDQIVIGLADVVPGSVTLAFASSTDELTTPALEKIARSLANNDFYALPEDSVKSLRVISKFSQARNCTAEIYAVNGDKKLLAAITPETHIQDYEPIKGETIIYGVVTRVGGANEDSPTIQIRTIEGRLIYCTANRKTAKIAAQRLYQQIGLIGMAEWDVKTYEIKAFTVTEISSYEMTPLPEAVESLSQNYGQHFDAIDDVDSFVRELRE